MENRIFQAKINHGKPYLRQNFHRYCETIFETIYLSWKTIFEGKVITNLGKSYLRPHIYSIMENHFHYELISSAVRQVN